MCLDVVPWRGESRRGCGWLRMEAEGLPREPFLVPSRFERNRLVVELLARQLERVGFAVSIRYFARRTHLRGTRFRAKICVYIMHAHEDGLPIPTARKNSKSPTAASTVAPPAPETPQCGGHASRGPEGSMAPRPELSTPAVNPNPRWNACVTTGPKRYVHFDDEQQAKRRDRARKAGIPVELVEALKDFIVTSSRFVEIHREGCEPVRFRINRLKGGRITFTDSANAKRDLAGPPGCGERCRL